MSNQSFGEETRQSLQDLVETLRRERDQLSVQVRLGKMELRDEWQDVESKWHGFERKVEEANEDARQSLHEIGQEISEIYHKLKQRLD